MKDFWFRKESIPKVWSTHATQKAKGVFGEKYKRGEKFLYPKDY